MDGVQREQVAVVLVDVLRGPDRQRERHERHEAVQPNPQQHRKSPQGVQIVIPLFGLEGRGAILHSLVLQKREKTFVRRPEP